MVPVHERGLIHQKHLIPPNHQSLPYEAVYGIKPHREKLNEQSKESQSEQEENKLEESNEKIHNHNKMKTNQENDKK